MYKEFYPINQSVQIKSKSFRKDPALPQDGFSIVIKEDGVCRITYQSARAKEFAKRTLRSLGKKGNYPVCYLKDYPSFPMRGVVEGFYGKPYTHEQRLSLMPLLAQLKMNAYVYAPKDDLFHRDRWREEYPVDEENKLRQLFERAKENKIDFFFAISPGKDFDFASQKDYEILLAKLKKVQSFGVKKFALLMDDIEPKLSEEGSKRFTSPAHAQAYLANFLLKELRPGSPFLFCPTDYMQNFDTPYRAELRKYLDEQISVFWTGYNTVAEAITEEDGKTVCQNFGRKPILWENYPVNDFNPKRRIYLGAITNRGRKLHETHTGYIVNLSELFECSKIPLMTMAEYAWDCESYDPEKALQRAVSRYFKGCAKEGEILVERNKATIMQSNPKKVFNEKTIEKYSAYYQRQARALSYLEKRAPSGFLEETQDLRSFMQAECILYEIIRKGGSADEVIPFVKGMNESKYCPYDLSLLAYANEKYALQTPFTVDEERIIYRKW